MPIRKRGHFTDEMSAGKFKKRKIYIEKRKSLKIKVLRFLVPGAGVEPARIAPLVFETSASTDSAIRAGVLFL